MTEITSLSPHPDDIARQVAVFPKLKQRRQRQSNIWFFDSPKNNQRLTISTDVAFMHLVILEGDTSVIRYIAEPEPVLVHVDGRQCELRLDAHVYRCDGSVEWWNFKRLQNGGKSRAHLGPDAKGAGIEERAAYAAGVPYYVKTDIDLANQEILFDNWLTLCAIITRCRNQFLGREAEIFSQRMALQRAVTLENLIGIPGIDVAYMLAVVALALQSGTARTNLKSQLFGRSSLISGIE